MPRGGYRECGGRQKGSPNKGTELGRKGVRPSVFGRPNLNLSCL